MTEFRITIEKRIIEEDGKSGYFNEVYQQRKDFENFHTMRVINAFNVAEIPLTTGSTLRKPTKDEEALL